MNLESYFKIAIDKNASDLHLVAGCPPTLRIDGDLVKINNENIENKDLESNSKELVGSDSWKKFLINKDLDFSKNFFGSRFRINLHFQEGQLGLSARFIPLEIPRPEEIGFNETIYNLTHIKDGLVLVTGPSGSGKSTTLAAMINIINRERRAHIITIEDPIEFIFKEEQSIIEQRELGTDTTSFADALKYALRQDPNVIMVGEMRDLETISAALTAAETGHLVLSTLHTSSAPETIARIVDVFPAHQQQQVLIQLSSTLRAVIAQDLMPKAGGGVIVARELLLNNNAVANLIHRSQFNQIYSVIQTSAKEGMITMNKSIDQLLKDGKITEDTANNRRRDIGSKAAYY
jgi:twitching motility protein PilT